MPSQDPGVSGTDVQLASPVVAGGTEPEPGVAEAARSAEYPTRAGPETEPVLRLPIQTPTAWSSEMRQLHMPRRTVRSSHVRTRCSSPCHVPPLPIVHVACCMGRRPTPVEAITFHTDASNPH